MSASILRMMRGVRFPFLSTGKKGRAGMFLVPSWWKLAYFLSEPTSTVSAAVMRHLMDCLRLPLLIRSGRFDLLS
jgi:hypothetical protein